MAEKNDKTGAMQVDIDLVRQLAAVLDDTNLTEIEVEQDDNNAMGFGVVTAIQSSDGTQLWAQVLPSAAIPEQVTALGDVTGTAADVVSWSGKLNQYVLEKTPQDLREENRQRMVKYCSDDFAVRQFLRRGGFNVAIFEKRVELDRWYVSNWTVWHDIAILFKTVPALLKREGAY